MDVLVPAYAGELESVASYDWQTRTIGPAEDQSAESAAPDDFLPETVKPRNPRLAVLAVTSVLLVGAGALALTALNTPKPDYEPVAYKECAQIVFGHSDTADDFLTRHFKCDSGIAVEVLSHPTPQPKRRAPAIIGEAITPLDAGPRPRNEPSGLCWTQIGGMFRELGPAGDGRIVAIYELPPWMEAADAGPLDCKGGEVRLLSETAFK